MTNSLLNDEQMSNKVGVVRTNQQDFVVFLGGFNFSVLCLDVTCLFWRDDACGSVFFKIHLSIVE